MDSGAEDKKVYTLIYGHTDAYYVGLCLDRNENRVYFSDLTR